ncbi:MAG: T9SS C-terminal target domain-containing protein [Bacteroidetes bacterium]|nr:MAG: T9SS C-terminal target domain-containing protein [Bacteroidota bacterium]
MNFEAKASLGKSTIQYQLFPQLPVTEFKAFKVRNGGSDWSSTGIRDAFNHTLMEGAMDVDHQYNRPVILYINGDYWGVISMTEKIDEHFLKGHHPSINKDSVDLLYSNAEVKRGDANSYNAMISFITNNSLAQQANYNYIKTQIDIPEYMNYFQTRIYYASTDWPNKNIYYWRPKDQSMKWRWIMWDTDRSTLLTTNPNHPCNYTHNTLSWATTSSSVADWAQFLLNNLLLNSEFKTGFITQFAHHMNFSFCPQRVDSVLNVFRTRLHNELPAHINRWKNSNDTIDYFTRGYYQSRAQWNTEVDTIQLFFNNRAKNMRKFIMQKFSISDTFQLSLNKVPMQGGVIEIDTFRVPNNPCKLVYFKGYPVTIRAVPNPGYVFSGWTTAGGSLLPVTWVPNGDTTVTAYFSPAVITQPTVPSTNFSAGISNCTNLQLSWTSGNGASRIVVARAASAVNSFPQNQQSYTANSVFGSGSNLGNGNFVVYSGTGNSVTVSGLSAGVTYHFAIIEFNGSGNTSVYNTTNYLSGNASSSSFTTSITSSGNTICAGESATLTANGGVSWQWTPSTGLSSTSSRIVTASPASTTTYTVLATDNNGCQATSSFTLTVYPLPIVSLSNFSGLCQNAAAITLTGGSPTGGVYSGTGVTSGMFNPAIAGVGTHNITYTYTFVNGCVNSASKSITVHTLPNVTQSSYSDLCQNSTPITLNGGSPSGGTYSGTGVSGGSFNPLVAGVGSHVITYSYTDSNGCSGSATSVIKVNSSPVVSLGTFNSVCQNASPVNLVGGSPSGGTYSGSGVSGNIFSPSAAGAGTHAITYTYVGANGCPGTATSSINVLGVPTVSLSNFNGMCLTSAAIALSGGSPSGGVYSGVGVSGGMFNPASAGVGTHTITYTYTNSNGCANSAVSSISVSNMPTVSLASFNSLCQNAAPITLTGGSPAGGVYSGPGVSGGVFNPANAGAGVHTLTYTYADAGGCSNSASSSIQVNSLPNVSLASFSNLCINSSPVLLSGGIPAGGIYTGAGVSGGMINPALAGVGNHVVTYSFTDANSCSASASNTILVSDLPIVSLASFNDVCLNSSPVSLSGGNPIGGIYSGLGVSGGVFNPSIAGTGSHQINYTFTNSGGCSSSATSSINVTNVPNVTLHPFNNYCQNSAPFLLSGGSPSGGTYSGNGINAGTFDPASAGVGSHVVTYLYTNPVGCSNTATAIINVYSLPNVTLNALGGVCINSAPIALSGGSPAGGVYSGVGVNGGFFDPAIAGMGNHTIIYYYTDNNSCENFATSIISVGIEPVVLISSFSDMCENETSVALTGGSPPGGVYSGNGVVSGMFDPSLSGLGVHTVTYTFSNGAGCSSSASADINVNPNPSVQLGNDTVICAYHQIILDAGSGLSGYLWSTGATNQFIIADSSGLGLGAISYSVIGTNAFGCSASDTLTVTFDVCATIDKLASQSLTDVYPNPFDQEIYVRTFEADFIVEIIDVLGKTVYRKFISGDYSVIQPQVRPGVYFIKIENEKLSITRKLIKAY